MKKKLFSLLTALVLCLLCAVPAFAEMPLVMDAYELFKPEATAELEQKAQDASAGHGVNVYLLTVSDIGGQNVREFAKDWYRNYDLGYGDGKSGILYCTIRDYQPYMATICFGVYLFKLVDGAADVYEGRLQQADKLYLAGISQTLRSAAVFLVFTVLLFVTRNIAIASVGMGIAATASLVLVTVPLALLETEKSRRWRLEEVTTFFAAGPDVRPGTVHGSRSMVDEAPTMAAMLGLTMPDVDGAPIFEILR